MAKEGAATKTDENCINNEVKLRAVQMCWEADASTRTGKAASRMQCNHRAEGFLCGSEITHAPKKKHMYACIKCLPFWKKLQSLGCTITIHLQWKFKATNDLTVECYTAVASSLCSICLQNVVVVSIPTYAENRLLKRKPATFLCTLKTVFEAVKGLYLQLPGLSLNMPCLIWLFILIRVS